MRAKKWARNISQNYFCFKVSTSCFERQRHIQMSFVTLSLGRYFWCFGSHLAIVISRRHPNNSLTWILRMGLSEHLLAARKNIWRSFKLPQYAFLLWDASSRDSIGNHSEAHPIICSLELLGFFCYSKRRDEKLRQRITQRLDFVQKYIVDQKCPFSLLKGPVTWNLVDCLGLHRPIVWAVSNTIKHETLLCINARKIVADVFFHRLTPSSLLADERHHRRKKGIKKKILLRDELRRNNQGVGREEGGMFQGNL